MSIKDHKKDISKLSPQEREALAKELFDKATHYTKRNHDDPEESSTVMLIDRAIKLCPKPYYYYRKAHELFWEYSNMDDYNLYFDEIHRSPYKKPFIEVLDWKEKYRKLFSITAKALELKPDYSPAYYMNAQIRNQLGEYEQALVEIHKALSIRDNVAFYNNTLHEILLNMGDLDGSLAAIDKAYEMHPDNTTISRNKRLMSERLGKYAEALEIAQKENNTEVGWSDNKLQVIIPLLMKLDDYDQARELIIKKETEYESTEEFYDLYTTLYEQSEFSFLTSLPAADFKLQLRGLWIFFWANIRVGNFDEARDFLIKMEFTKELSTDFQDEYTIRIKKNQESKDSSSESMDNSQSAFKRRGVEIVAYKFSVSNLFSLAQPYEKVPMDIFLLLLKKIFNGRYATQYFDERLGEFQQKWVTEPELISQRTTYGEQYYDISLKIMLLGDVARFVHKLNKKKAVLFSLLQHAMNTSLMSAMNSIMLKVQLDERNRILANLSHSVKGIVKSVIDPLESLRRQVPQQEPIIANAIKGANQIREIVNAVNFSLKTVFEELQWDILNPGQDSSSLGEMILDSLKDSISNMFDFRYFQVYAESYFPSKLSPKEFDRIKAEWGQVASEVSIEGVIDFANRNLFRLETNLDASQNFRAGNEKSSAAKLRILFQEIIFNAVKYASFVSAGARMVAITLVEEGDDLKLEVKNSYSPQVHAKTTGVGKIVIENFAKVLNCQPEVKTDGTTYSLTIEFNNIWRNHAKDPLH